MKSKDEIIAGVDAYRTKARRFDYSYLGVGALAIIALFGSLAFLTHQLPRNNAMVLLIWFPLGFGLLIALASVQAAYRRRFAKECGLICSACSRPATSADLKLIVASRNCPYCGTPFY